MVKVDGYKNMDSDVSRQEVAVTFDSRKTDPQALAKAINANTDYKASAPKK